MKFLKLKLALSGVLSAALVLLSVPSANAAASGVIAYGSGGAVHVRNADGTNDKTVFSYNSANDALYTLALNSDGSRLMVQLFDGSNTAVTVVNTADGSIVKQLSGATIGFAYDISPDGTKLLASGTGSPVLVTIATGALSVLPSFPAGTPRGFTPDGSAVILQFDNTANSTKDIQRYTIATNAVATVKAGVASSATSTLLPSAPSYDGTLMYTSSNGSCGAATQSGIIKTDGTGDGAFSTPTTDSRAIFSPDGSEVLFTRSGSPLTVSCSGGGGEAVVSVLRGLRSGSGSASYLSAAAFDWSNGTVLAAAVAAPVASGPTLADTGTSLTAAVLAVGILVATVIALSKTRRIFKLAR